MIQEDGRRMMFEIGVIYDIGKTTVHNILLERFLYSIITADETWLDVVTLC